MRKTLINVCGISRSGSTMVDLMLGNDPHAFSLGEVYAWFRPFRSHHFNIVCSCKKSNCPWDTLKLFEEKDFYKKCFEVLNIDCLVDSSKNLPWVIDNNLWCSNQNDVTVRNVLLFKDPINFFYSYWKRGYHPERIMKNGNIPYYTRYYKRFFQAGIPFITVNYNKLVANPATMLENLCNILEIPYFAGKECFWEKEHHQIFGSLGTRKQVENSKSKIRKKEDYSQEFKTLIPKIEADIKKNHTIQSIISKLKASELNDNGNFPVISIRKPMWYYRMKTIQKVKKRFPDKWEYDQ